jgi:hypothetical protein
MNSGFKPQILKRLQAIIDAAFCWSRKSAQVRHSETMERQDYEK